MIAVAIVVAGIMYEPLVAIFGVTVLGTSMLASSMERKNRKYEELLGERVYEERFEGQPELGYKPHRAV